MAAFNTFGHIALKVRDLDASIAFYEKLGFPEFLRLTFFQPLGMNDTFFTAVRPPKRLVTPRNSRIVAMIQSPP